MTNEAMSKLLAECPEMKRLRDELTKRGIEWHDDSESFDGIHTFIRTKWLHKGFEVSVIWGYSKAFGGKYGISYGYPNMLECWYQCCKQDPEPMTVDEIVEAYA